MTANMIQQHCIFFLRPRDENFLCVVHRIPSLFLGCEAQQVLGQEERKDMTTRRKKRKEVASDPFWSHSDQRGSQVRMVFLADALECWC